MTEHKDLAYWKARGGQIEWRLENMRIEISQMETDLAECDENIRALVTKSTENVTTEKVSNAERVE